VSCSHSSLKGIYPNIFFCINENTGNIYNTDLIRRMESNEVFNVSIAAQTKKGVYPHRVFKISLNIFLDSLCNGADLVTRRMSIARCQAPCAYSAHFKPLVKGNSLEHSYDVNIEISRQLKPYCANKNLLDQRFLVAMMIKTKWTRPPRQEEIGNYIRFTLRNKHQKTEAFYYLRKSQVSFENTFVHQMGASYTLTAHKYNHKLNHEKPYKFDWALWGVYLIPMDNYCSIKPPKCRLLFEDYHRFTRATNYNEMCGDLDIEGYKSMYGKCNRKYLHAHARTFCRLLMLLRRLLYRFDIVTTSF